jgi:FeS assembly SUF system regulator
MISICYESSGGKRMIKLTRLTDYSVVVMTHLAFSPERVHAATDVAEEIRLPLPTVSKILGSMARAGLLKSHRGLNGGFSLARPLSEISVGEIISAVEGPIAITDCLDDGPSDCSLEALCPTRFYWQKINDAIKKALDAVSLEDLVQRPQFPVFPEMTRRLGDPAGE